MQLQTKLNMLIVDCNQIYCIRKSNKHKRKKNIFLHLIVIVSMTDQKHSWPTNQCPSQRKWKVLDSSEFASCFDFSVVRMGLNESRMTHSWMTATQKPLRLPRFWQPLHWFLHHQSQNGLFFCLTPRPCFCPSQLLHWWWSCLVLKHQRNHWLLFWVTTTFQGFSTQTIRNRDLLTTRKSDGCTHQQ